MVDGDENTPANAPVQAQVNAGCEKAATRGKSDAMPRDERGGERLDRVLKASGINRSRLADKADVAPSTVQKWYAALQKGKISDEMWTSCAHALMRAGINPQDVRPDAPLPEIVRAADLIDPILDIEDSRILSIVLKVLLLDSEDDRETIRNLVKGRIKKL